MLFKVSDKIRGEIMIPSVDRTLVAGSTINLNPEEYKSYDILTCIQKGYLIPEEEKTKDFTDFEEMNKKEIKIKNIGKNPLILRDVLLNPGDAIFISEEFLKNSYVQKAISIKALKVVKDKVDEKIIDEVKKILESDENEEKVEEQIEEEIKKLDKTTMRSWDPHEKKSLNKAESHKKVFGNKPIEKENDIEWIDKEENEQEENQKESKIIKKFAIKKKKSKRKTKKVAKKKNVLKPVGKKRTPPVDGIFSSDEFVVPSETNLAFELDSQGNFVGNKDISFVDDEQKEERIKAHPKLSENNSEIE